MKGKKESMQEKCAPEGRILLVGLTRLVPSLPAEDKQKAQQFAVSWTSASEDEDKQV